MNLSLKLQSYKEINRLSIDSFFEAPLKQWFNETFLILLPKLIF